MEMSNAEIARSYRTAANHKKQVGILAELNATSKEEIIGILMAEGALNPKTIEAYKRRNMLPKTETEEREQKPEEAEQKPEEAEQKPEEAEQKPETPKFRKHIPFMVRETMQSWLKENRKAYIKALQLVGDFEEVKAWLEGTK